MKNKELLIEALKTNESKDIKNLITQFLLSNELQKKSKFNPYNYVSKDELRPAITGVFHSNGYKVATNTHILIAYTDDYNDDLESKIVNKKGAIIDARYPNWEAVIPTDDNLQYFDLDTSKMTAILAKYKLDKKLDKDSKKFINFKGTHFNVEYFASLCSFADFIGTKQIGLNNNLTRACKVHVSGNVGILMPVMSECLEDCIIYKF